MRRWSRCGAQLPDHAPSKEEKPYPPDFFAAGLGTASQVGAEVAVGAVAGWGAAWAANTSKILRKMLRTSSVSIRIS